MMRSVIPREAAAALFLQVGKGRNRPIRAQRTDHLPAHLDGHADEGHVLPIPRSTGPRPVQELRLFGDLRHDGGPACLDDLAGDPFPQLVASGLAKAVRGLDADLTSLPVQQGEGRELHPQGTGQRLQDGLHDGAKIEARIQDLADLEEQGELRPLSTQARQMFHVMCSSRDVEKVDQEVADKRRPASSAR